MNPDSTTTEGEPLEADLPGWGASRRNALDQLDPNATTVSVPPGPAMATDDLPPLSPHEASAAMGDVAEDLDDRYDEEPPEREPTRPAGTSRRSDGDPRIAGVAAQLFATIAGALSLALNATIGHGSGAFVMHPEEAMGIGDPLGRIAARHAPIDSGEATDMGDAIEAGAAAAAYGARASIQHMTERTGNAMPDPQQPLQ
jgi:hypothetical protein